MRLPIVQYGHPALRQKGARIERVTPELRALVSDMLETMEAASGIGLAAQQVGHALQLAVIDVSGVEDRPSTMEIDGRPIDPSAHMPLVLINPELTLSGAPVPSAEGCLSFPEVFAEIARPPVTRVRAQDLAGQSLEFRCSGLLARAIQHEYDHLQGILFIDRMDPETKQDLRGALDALQAATKAALKSTGSPRSK